MSDAGESHEKREEPGRELRSAFRNFLYAASGSVAYRLAALILLSIYAATLGPEGFGWLEQLLALSLFIAPLISVQAHEAFLPLYQKDRATGALAAASILVPACVAVLVVGWGLTLLGTGRLDAAAVLAAHVVATIVWQYIRNLLRASGRYDVAMTSEVTLSLVSLAVGVLLLAWFGYGVEGALLGIAAGAIAASLVALWRSSRFGGLFAGAAVSRDAVATVLTVSARLVPNVLLWWAIELSDRLILAYFVGDRAVGLYSAGARVAGILMAAMLLLYQVWQIPAIRAVQEGAGGEFLSKTFRLYVLVVSAGASALLSVAEPLTMLLLGEVYQDSLRYTAILIPSLCLAALCYFFGILYYSTSNRSSALTASAAGLIVSLAINLIYIPRFGAIAAAVSTFAAYLVMCVLRYRETRASLGFRIKWLDLWLPLAVIGLQSTGLYLKLGEWLWVGAVLLLIWSRRELWQFTMSLRSEGSRL